ncbi:hypothetical protein CANINC_000526 [Pichia inconspicua]|uniref:Mannosyl-oligosaccharide glucosidase n=1 Tax=Pichia inconspicua TaxID=52247 RepID=A0A4T0X5X2_9ASCO|nr:hypothetical protein CANINC_000526 [[Candida] inconspicua]
MIPVAPDLGLVETYGTTSVLSIGTKDGKLDIEEAVVADDVRSLKVRESTVVTIHENVKREVIDVTNEGIPRGKSAELFMPDDVFDPCVSCVVEMCKVGDNTLTAFATGEDDRILILGRLNLDNNSIKFVKIKALDMRSMVKQIEMIVVRECVVILVRTRMEVHLLKVERGLVTKLFKFNVNEEWVDIAYSTVSYFSGIIKMAVIDEVGKFAVFESIADNNIGEFYKVDLMFESIYDPVDLSHFKKLVWLEENRLLLFTRTQLHEYNFDTEKLRCRVSAGIWSKLLDFVPNSTKTLYYSLTSKEVIVVDVNDGGLHRRFAWKHYLNDTDTSMYVRVVNFENEELCIVTSKQVPVSFVFRFTVDGMRMIETPTMFLPTTNEPWVSFSLLPMGSRFEMILKVEGAVRSCLVDVVDGVCGGMKKVRDVLGDKKEIHLLDYEVDEILELKKYYKFSGHELPNSSEITRQIYERVEKFLESGCTQITLFQLTSELHIPRRVENVCKIVEYMIRNNGDEQFEIYINRKSWMVDTRIAERVEANDETLSEHIRELRSSIEVWKREGVFDIAGVEIRIAADMGELGDNVRNVLAHFEDDFTVVGIYDSEEEHEDENEVTTVWSIPTISVSQRKNVGVKIETSDSQSESQRVSQLSQRRQAVLEEGGLEKLNEKRNLDSLKWGPFRSNVYVGVRPRIPESLIAGLMWFPTKGFDGMQKAKHACDQGDNIEKFGWVKYDPRFGGREEIIDSDCELKLNVEFVKNENGENWALRVNGKAMNEDAVNSVVFYTGLESDGSLEFEGEYVEGSDNLVDGELRLKGFVDKLGGFNIEIVDSKDNEYAEFESKSLQYDKGFDPSKTHHVSLKVPGEHVWQGSEIFWTLVQMNVEDVETREIKPSSFSASELFQVRNPGGFTGNLHFVQKTFVGDFQFDIVYNKVGEKDVISAGEDVSERLKRVYDIIDTKFAENFQLNAPFNDVEHIKFAKEILSQLLGGLLYQYGDQLVDRNALVDDVKFTHAELHGELEGPHELFSFVPSRPFFPRGFYWDEGFHLLPILKYDTELALDVLHGWFKLVDEDGWIAREQILGSESRSKVPPEFTVQNPRIANPPTMLMVLGDIISSGVEVDKKLLSEMYPLLQRHYEWFRRTQRGDAADIDHRAERYPYVDEVYRWKGRTRDHCLPSGLDDYPRCPADTSELDVDLLSWVGVGARAMQEVAARLGEVEDARVYGEQYKRVVRNLEVVHWNSEEGLFCDVTEDEDGESDEFACHEGYVSLMPFMLGHIANSDSEKLMAAVASIVDEEKLASVAGVRSLSARDACFHQGGDDYWRGHVWMNMTFLALRALERYSSGASDASVRAACRAAGAHHGNARGGLIRLNQLKLTAAMSSGRKKVEKLELGDATTLVREYLSKEYRPYAVSDLMLNLHNRVSKNLLVTILDTGVEDGVFIVKRYGKLSFYCSAEKQIPLVAEPLNLAKLQELHSHVENVSKQVAEVKRAISALPVESDRELVERVEFLQKRRLDLLERIAKMDTTIIEQPALDITLVEQRARKLTLCLKRVVDTIREARDEPREEFFSWLESLGLKTRGLRT